MPVKKLLIFTALILCACTANAQTFLKNFASVGTVVRLGKVLIFSADDGNHGVELWKSDGTTEGTVMVKDIQPGTAGSNTANLTVCNGLVYFTANDGQHGLELWKTDGTTAKTVMVKDLNSIKGLGGSNPYDLINFNDHLFFGASGDKQLSNYYSTLWRTNGTAAGTVSLTKEDYSRVSQLTVVKNILYFLQGQKLWETDGTTAGTKIINVDDYYTIDLLHAINDELVFITNISYRQKIRLYKLNPSATKPVLLQNFDAVMYGDIDINNITQSNKGFFFSINTTDANSNGADYLWHSDGTKSGTKKLKNFAWQWYMSGSSMHNFVNYNNKLYFAATPNLTLWSSDGTASGTVQMSTNTVDAVAPCVSNNKLFYSSNGSLWAIDKSGNSKNQFLSMIKPLSFIDFDGVLYFTARASYNTPTGLWNNKVSPNISVTANYQAVANGGKIDYQSKVDSALIKSFTVSNLGSRELVLSEISVSGTPFYVNGSVSPVLSPGQQAFFKLEYLPGKEEFAKGTLNIRSNDALQGNFIVNLSGNSQGQADQKRQLPDDGLNKSVSILDSTAVIMLSNNSIDEKKSAGTTVGKMSVKNDVKIYSYSLVSGSGDADNSKFKIADGILKSDKIFDFSIKSTYTIRVKAVNGKSSFQQIFAIKINKIGDHLPTGSCDGQFQNLAGSFADVDFCGKHIFIVGDNGKIFKSADEAKTWTEINSGTSYNLSTIKFTDTKTGFITGDGSTMLKTVDAGNSWFQVDVQGLAIRNVSFVNSQVGYVFSDGIILKTINGAHSWTRTTLNVYSNINSSSFIDEKTGFICGDDLTMLRTKDGGVTWQNITTVPLGQYTKLQKIVFVNAKTGYLLSYDGDICKTTDGGDTWKRVSTISNDNFNDMYFQDEKHGYIIAESNAIYKTSNGGTSWVFDKTDALGTFRSIKYNKDANLTLVVGRSESFGSSAGPGSAILVKSGSSTWQLISRLPSDDITDINFVDNKNGYLFGPGGNVKTIDGGITWKSMNLSSSAYYYNFRSSFFIKNIGYAATIESIYKTADGGETWKKLNNKSLDQQVRNLYFITADIGFYTTQGSDGGFIFKTIDGGKTWSKSTVPDAFVLYNMQFVNNTTGYAVGGNSSGFIFKTTDQGKTWKTIFTFKPADENNVTWLTNIKMFNASTGIATGFDGLILRTTNAGQTWTRINSTIENDINFMKFLDDKHGYVITGSYGSYNVINETLDGGLTWKFAKQTENEIYAINGVGNQLYVVGSQGLFLKSTMEANPLKPGYIVGDTKVEQFSKTDYYLPVNPDLSYNWTVSPDAKINYTGNYATVQWAKPGKYQLKANTSTACGIGGTSIINVEVVAPPQPKVTGPQAVVYGSSSYVTYTTPAHANSIYKWRVSGDSTFTTSGNAIKVIWGQSGVGEVEVVETSQNTDIKKSSILNVSINKKEQIISFTANQSKKYGDPDFIPAKSSSASYLYYSSSDTSVATIIYGKVHIVKAGKVTLTAYQPGDNNYNTAKPVSKTITISRVPLTIKADNKSKVTGKSNPVLTATYTGFVNGENVMDLTNPPELSTTATKSSVPGSYPITVKGALSYNYNINYVAGKLVVSAANSSLITAQVITQPLVHPALSPNGDGVNDVLLIDNITNYPDNKFTLMDKSGAGVYATSGYNNTSKLFDGHAINNVLLKPGTYYYLLDYKDNGTQKRLTGYVLIKY